MDSHHFTQEGCEHLTEQSSFIGAVMEPNISFRGDVHQQNLVSERK